MLDYFITQQLDKKALEFPQLEQFLPLLGPFSEVLLSYMTSIFSMDQIKHELNYNWFILQKDMTSISTLTQLSKSKNRSLKSRARYLPPRFIAGSWLFKSNGRVWYCSVQNKTIPSMGHPLIAFNETTTVGLKSPTRPRVKSWLACPIK